MTGRRRPSVRLLNVDSAGATFRLRVGDLLIDTFVPHGEEVEVKGLVVAGPRHWILAGYSQRVEVEGSGGDVEPGEKIPVVELPR